MKLYLLASPNASDAKAVKNIIYEIEYKQDKAAKESSPQAIAAREQNKFEDLPKKIDGRRYTWHGPNYVSVIDVRGKVLIGGRIYRGEYSANKDRVEIRGRETTVPFDDVVVQENNFVNAHGEATYIISEDGDRITRRWWKSNGENFEGIFLWQR